VRRPLTSAALAAALVIAAALPAAHAAPSAARAKPIYFFQFVGARQTPRVRPPRITFAADGNHTVTGLHWHGWGSSNARATGTDHVNNCSPSCAQGHASRVHVHVTLSHPGRFHGRRMYLCYRVRPGAASYLHGCL
jgi:hypothetical protein